MNNEYLFQIEIRTWQSYMTKKAIKVSNNTKKVNSAVEFATYTLMRNYNRYEKYTNVELQIVIDTLLEDYLNFPEA